MEDKDKIVVYKSFSDDVAAHMVMDILQENGIECFLSGENLNYTGMPLPIAGINLHLFEKDIPRATEILKEQRQK
ncbi:MAG: DUF2007 domain-containing protein [Bacteroidaceae bacterium]|nr:DUF2007 domain-containing protein [Bacteroidaceae bacterium]